MSDKQQAAQGAMAVLSPEVAEAYRSLQRGDLRGCETRCREVLERDAGHGDALHLLGLVQCAGGRTEEGVASLRKAVQATPQHSVYRLSLGRQLAARGDDKAAIDEFKQALTHAPKMAQAAYEMGQCYERLGERRAALEAYQKSVDVRGDFAPGHYALAGLLRQTGQREDAAERYRQALAARPEFGEAHYNLGLLLRDMGRLEEAEESLGRATELLGEFAPAHISRGAVLASMHRYAEAEACLLRAIELTPDDFNAQVNLGNVLLFQNRPDEAQARFEAALRLDPSSSIAQLGVGLALRGQLRVSEAVPAIERALDLEPDSVQAMYALAEAHDRIHEWDQAASWALRAAEHRETHLPSQELLARLDRMAGRAEDAERRLLALLDAAPRDMMRVRVLKELGHLEKTRGNADTAKKRFHEAAAIWRDIPEIKKLQEAPLSQTLASYPEHISPSVVSTWDEQPPEDGLGAPVILCGFPRTGVSLVEQMLGGLGGVVTSDSAPLLAPVLMHVGQTAGAYRPYPECLDDLLDDQIAECRRLYWEAAERFVPGVDRASILVDQEMLSLVHLGLVRRAFPDAKVLMVHRDPRDTIVECYSESHTPGPATASFGTLEGIAEAHGAFYGLWGFMKSALGLAFMEVRYEDVVRDPKTVMQGIGEWLGAPWDESSIKPEQRVRGRAIRSHAYRDLAQPVTDRFIGVHRLFGGDLAPLAETIKSYMTEHGYS